MIESVFYIIVYIILSIDYNRILNYINYVYLFNIALLLYTYLFIEPINGAKVWIKLGNVSI